MYQSKYQYILCQRSLIYTPKLSINHCDRTKLQDPKRLTGYSCTETSKPYTFSPCTRSAKLRLSPNQYLLFRFVLISNLRIRLSLALYFTLRSLTKSPSTSTYLLTLHFDRQCPGIGTQLAALASASSYIALIATSKFLADVAWSNSQIKNPVIKLLVLSFSTVRSSKWFLPPSIPAKSRLSKVYGGENSIASAAVQIYCFRFLLLLWIYRCLCHTLLNLFSSLTALLLLSSSSLACLTNYLFFSIICSLSLKLLFSLWICSLSFCLTARLSSSTSRSSSGRFSNSSLDNFFSLMVDNFWRSTSLNNSSFLLQRVLIVYMLFITLTDWYSFSELSFCTDRIFFRISLFSSENSFIFGQLRASSSSLAERVASKREVSLLRSVTCGLININSCSTLCSSFSMREHWELISSVPFSDLDAY